MPKKEDALQMQSLVSAPPFRMRRFVKWSEVDAAAIAYTPHLLNYSIEAAEQWFGYVVGKHLRKFQLQYDVDTPIAHCSMDFKLPLELNDSVDLVLLLTRIGNKSYSLAIDGLDGQNRLRLTPALSRWHTHRALRNQLTPALILQRCS